TDWRRRDKIKRDNCIPVSCRYLTRRTPWSVRLRVSRFNSANALPSTKLTPAPVRDETLVLGQEAHVAALEESVDGAQESGAVGIERADESERLVAAAKLVEGFEFV